MATLKNMWVYSWFFWTVQNRLCCLSGCGGGNIWMCLSHRQRKTFHQSLSVFFSLDAIMLSRLCICSADHRDAQPNISFQIHKLINSLRLPGEDHWYSLSELKACETQHEEPDLMVTEPPDEAQLCKSAVQQLSVVLQQYNANVFSRNLLPVKQPHDLCVPVWGSQKWTSCRAETSLIPAGEEQCLSASAWSSAGLFSVSCVDVTHPATWFMLFCNGSQEDCFISLEHLASIFRKQFSAVSGPEF